MKMMVKLAATALVAAMTVTALAPMTAQAAVTPAQAASAAHEMGDIANEVKVAIRDGKTAVIDVTRIKDYSWASKRVWKEATDENGLTKVDLTVKYVVKRTVKTYVIPAGTDSALFWDETNHFGGFDFIASQIGVTPTEVK